MTFDYSKPHRLLDGVPQYLNEQEIAELRIKQAANAVRAARENILQQIQDLETLVTPRRLREAILSGDKSFIQTIESDIQALRTQLTQS